MSFDIFISLVVLTLGSHFVLLGGETDTCIALCINKYIYMALCLFCTLDVLVFKPFHCCVLLFLYHG